MASFISTVVLPTATTNLLLQDGQQVGQIVSDTNVITPVFVKIFQSKPVGTTAPSSANIQTSLQAAYSAGKKYYVGLVTKPNPFPFSFIVNEGYLLLGSDTIAAYGSQHTLFASYFITGANIRDSAILATDVDLPYKDAFITGQSFILPLTNSGATLSIEPGVAYTTAALGTGGKSALLLALEENNSLKAQLAAKSSNSNAATSIIATASGADGGTNWLKIGAYVLVAVGVVIGAMALFGVFKKKPAHRKGVRGIGEIGAVGRRRRRSGSSAYFKDSSGHWRSRKTNKWVSAKVAKRAA